MSLIDSINRKIERFLVVRAIRDGLIMVIPVLMLGSFALIVQTFPLPAYQRFVSGFLGGAVLRVGATVQNATFGLLSVYMTACVSNAFVANRGKPTAFTAGPPIVSLVCFAVMCGFLQEDFSFASFGAQGMFTALFSALAASALYLLLAERLPQRTAHALDDADFELRQIFSAIAPMLCTIGVFVALNMLIHRLAGLSGFHALFIHLCGGLFGNMGRTLSSAALFVFLSSLLWFFGVHGSDVLDDVAHGLFQSGMAQNIAAGAAGLPATEVYTKTFLDTFVLMGGCGSALCLLIALFFSRRRDTRSLMRMSSPFVVFNINEPMIFGLPVVFNPVFFLPFLLVPLVSLFTSALAVSLGLVPVAVHPVEWTTPVFLSGYLATGSWTGAALQLFNLAAGALLYLPFVRLHERDKGRAFASNVDALTRTLQKSELSHTPVVLTRLPGREGVVARMLASDLRHAVRRQAAPLFYQPQYDFQGRCVGAEALLRWAHPSYGAIYPPLVMRVAEESGLREELEKGVFLQAARDAGAFKARFGPDFVLSVNVTAQTVQSPRFEQMLELLLQGGEARDFCIELTEQAALCLTPETHALFQRAREKGFRFAIDDFSMGYTSLQYLQSGYFDLVKLDGSLVSQVQGNARSREIISSLLSLSRALHFYVLAEHVETEPQRRDLEGLGCLLYQGYLYSPAVPLAELTSPGFAPGRRQDG